MDNLGIVCAVIDCTVSVLTLIYNIYRDRREK